MGPRDIDMLNIGETADTGGSSTEGTVSAKENAILKILKNGGMPVVKSIQHGVVGGGSPPFTVKISKINTDKAVLFAYGGNSETRCLIREFTEDSFTLDTYGMSRLVWTNWVIMEFY